MDMSFKDIYGHDCSWYQERRKNYNTICASEEVKKNCPVACSVAISCYTNRIGAFKQKTYGIWIRQMPIKS